MEERLFWIVISLSFMAILALAWIGGALASRMGDERLDDTPFIPGIHPPGDEEDGHHGHP